MEFSPGANFASVTMCNVLKMLFKLSSQFYAYFKICLNQTGHEMMHYIEMLVNHCHCLILLRTKGLKHSGKDWTVDK